MKTEGVLNIHKIIELSNVSGVEYLFVNKQDKYDWINRVLSESKYSYKSTKRKDKSIVQDFLIKTTRLSKVQIKRLIQKKLKGGKLVVSYKNCNKFKVKYKSKDVSLLAITDNYHNRVNGRAAIVNMQREFNLYNKEEFNTISQISVSHLYRLRNDNYVYEKECLTLTKTNAVQRNIGIRRKPNSHGIPGYLRIDSVHQGDQEDAKGVYYINIVDEVTQYEFVACVPYISEYYLLPVLIDLIEFFPFKILNFHSDNGSEYINYTVAKLLEKLSIEQTKSRSGKHNDNALAESKNNSIIRKQFGYSYIPKSEAESINIFLFDIFNYHINYHRVCAYPTKSINEKGKIKTTYEEYNTPLGKLMSLPNFEIFLKPYMTKELLLAKEMEMSDNESAKRVREHYQKLKIKIQDVIDKI